MSATPAFPGYIDESGKVQLDEPGKMREYLRSLRHRRIEVIVRRERVQRSLDQNAYWHAVPFRLLAESFGYDAHEIPELKCALMGECWGWRLDPIAGKELPVKPHTSDMTTAEGAEFTDWLVRFGAKHGVIIPLPNEVAVTADDEVHP